MANIGHNSKQALTLSAVALVIQRDVNAAGDVLKASAALDNATTAAKTAKVHAYGHIIAYLYQHGFTGLAADGKSPAGHIKLADGTKSGAIKDTLQKESGVSSSVAKDYIELAAAMLRYRPSIRKAAEAGPQTVADALKSAGLDSQDAIRKAKDRGVEEAKIRKEAETRLKEAQKEAKGKDATPALSDIVKEVRAEHVAAKETRKETRKNADSQASAGKVRDGQERSGVDLGSLKGDALIDAAVNLYSRMNAKERETFMARVTKLETA